MGHSSGSDALSSPALKGGGQFSISTSYSLLGVSEARGGRAPGLVRQSRETVPLPWLPQQNDAGASRPLLVFLLVLRSPPCSDSSLGLEVTFLIRPHPCLGCSRAFGMPSALGTRAAHLYYLSDKMILTIYGMFGSGFELTFVNFV